MRHVGMFFTGNSHCRRGLIYLLHQGSKFRPRFNSRPKYTRGFRGRKESISAKMEHDGICADSRKRLLNGFDGFRILFADKFQRYMQRLRTHPARLRSKILRALHEAFQALADFRREIESNKDSHCVPGYISFRLTMSSAVCEANQRICLRSPGKILRTTSTPASLASA
jgi:hypothetical protein